MQGLNTTSALVAICQNDKFSFSFLQNTYLGLAQAVPSALSTLGFWYFQKYFKIRTKKMVKPWNLISHPPNLTERKWCQLMSTSIVAILIPFWGMLGIWTNIGCVFYVVICITIWPSSFKASIMSGNSGMYDFFLNLKSVAEILCRMYNVIFGLFQAPFYAFAQTMMAELTPPGYENMVS